MAVVDQKDKDAVEVTVAALQRGAAVVVPTDTVYGLAALPTNDAAIALIYELKGRPDSMPLPVLGASIDQVSALGFALGVVAEELAGRWWPGPLTLVCGFSPGAEPPTWLAGRDEAAVRVPDHDFLLQVMQRTGVLLVTSANPHGSPTPTTADAVATEFGARVELVIDGGELHAEPSTLVNVRGTQPIIEREGAIPSDAIAELVAQKGGTR